MRRLLTTYALAVITAACGHGNHPTGPTKIEPAAPPIIETTPARNEVAHETDD